MKASHLKMAIKHQILHVPQRISAYMAGSPGVGKSDLIRQIRNEIEVETGKKWGLIDLRAVLLDPVDLRGVPTIDRDSNTCKWTVPDFLPQVERDGQQGILFIDEFPSAPPLIQSACLQLFLDFKLGEYTLPEKWHVVCAGNLLTDGANVYKIATNTGNRFVHYEFSLDTEDWIDWAIDHGVMLEICAFIRYKPALLHSMSANKGGKAFASPRTWYFLSNLLKSNPAEELHFEMTTGTIGVEAGTEFLGFLKIYRDLPDPVTMLKDPAKAIIPKNPATLYAVVGAIANLATDKNMPNVVKYANKLTDSGKAEFSIVLIKDCLKHNKKLASTKAFIEWSAKHKDIII